MKEIRRRRTISDDPIRVVQLLRNKRRTFGLKKLELKNVILKFHSQIIYNHILFVVVAHL